MMAMFFFIAHEKGFTFHAQPQYGAYSCSLSNYRKMKLIFVNISEIAYLPTYHPQSLLLVTDCLISMCSGQISDLRVPLLSPNAQDMMATMLASLVITNNKSLAEISVLFTLRMGRRSRDTTRSHVVQHTAR